MEKIAAREKSEGKILPNIKLLTNAGGGWRRISWMMLLGSSLLWEFNNKEESLKLNFFYDYFSVELNTFVCFSQIVLGRKCFSLCLLSIKHPRGKNLTEGGKLKLFPATKEREKWIWLLVKLMELEKCDYSPDESSLKFRVRFLIE